VESNPLVAGRKGGFRVVLTVGGVVVRVVRALEGEGGGHNVLQYLLCNELCGDAPSNELSFWGSIVLLIALGVA